MYHDTLFGTEHRPEDSHVPNHELGQYPTPLWVAEAIVERYFPDLDSTSTVLEPHCGRGRFLQAIPAHVPAVGVEIDPQLAEDARRITGRTIITGDFQTVTLDLKPTAVISNPNFQVDAIEALLARCHRLLPDGGRCGLILPAYFFQTAGRVVEYTQHWSIESTMIPRNIYEGLSLPLVFAMFSKDRRRTLVGFALYREAVDAKAINEPYRSLLVDAPKGLWQSVVTEALKQLGGRASLSAIYRAVEGSRPTTTQFWREKIRQTLQRHSMFRPVDTGVWELAAA